MKEILLAILLPQLFVLPLMLALRAYKKGNGDGAGANTDGGMNVLSILRRAYVNLTRQKAAGYGPWIAAAIENNCGEPGVALTAIRFTIQDMLNTPTELYVLGVEYRFNLDGLFEAEAELLKIMGEGA